MLVDRGDLVSDAPARKMAGVPARDTREPLSRENGAQRLGFAREFVAELEPFVTDRLALSERGLERRLAAQPRQSVLSPRDRIDADANVNAHECTLGATRHPSGGEQFAPWDGPAALITASGSA